MSDEAELVCYQIFQGGVCPNPRICTLLSQGPTLSCRFSQPSTTYTPLTRMKPTVHFLTTLHFSESSPQSCLAIFFLPLWLSLHCHTSSYGPSSSTFVTLRAYESIPTSTFCQVSQTLGLYMNRTRVSDHMPSLKHTKSHQLFELDRIPSHTQILRP